MTYTISPPTASLSLSIKTLSIYVLNTIKWSGAEAPEEHIIDSKKLEADAYIDLYEITLSDKSTKVYLKTNNDVVWQGNLYEGTGIKITGVGSYSDDQVSRPKLSIFNPDGVYSYIVDQGLLDGATVVRLRVLKEHLDTDEPIYRSQKWKINRITSLKKNSLTVELRDMLDGQYFQVPGRMFIPPEFPQVSLT